MRAALVRGGVVENIILAADGFDPGAGLSVVAIGDQALQIGASYDGESFTAPAPVVIVPREVTAWQARRALLAAGLPDEVEAALAAMTGEAGAQARIDWEYGSAVRRDSEFIALLAPTLALSDAQVDALFIAAAAYS